MDVDCNDIPRDSNTVSVDAKEIAEALKNILKVQDSHVMQYQGMHCWQKQLLITVIH